MAFYLIQVAYKDTAAKTLIANPQTREDAIGKTCASLGGKLHSFFFSFGEYDVACIVELPDNTAAAAFALATSSKGAVSKFHTTILMSAYRGLGGDEKGAKGRLRSAGLTGSFAASLARVRSLDCGLSEGVGNGSGPRTGTPRPSGRDDRGDAQLHRQQRRKALHRDRRARRARQAQPAARVDPHR